MQIDNVNLLPQMNSTNSTSAGSQLVNQENIFQAELNEATNRLNNSQKTGIMTQEELEQRNKDIRDASVQMEALLLKMLLSMSGLVCLSVAMRRLVSSRLELLLPFRRRDSAAFSVNLQAHWRNSR